MAEKENMFHTIKRNLLPLPFHERDQRLCFIIPFSLLSFLSYIQFYSSLYNNNNNNNIISSFILFSLYSFDSYFDYYQINMII